MLEFFPRSRDSAGAGFGGGAAVERAEIPDPFKWDLDRIFPDWEAWEQAFAEIEAALPDLAARQGTLGDRPGELLAGVEAVLNVQRKLEVVRVYASMKSDEDTRIGENVGRRGRAQGLGVKFGEAVSWFEPEFLALDPATVARFTEEEPGLKLYDHFFDDLQRSRGHTLPPEQEALLAAAGTMALGAWQVFSALNNADLKFPVIKDEQGQEVELTKARYIRFLKSPDRSVRREAFRAFQDTYGAVINTLAANLDANVKNHVFYARARKHAGPLDAALHRNAVPTAVFHSLLETTEANLATVHRFTELKKRVLGLDPLREYDLVVSLFPGAQFKFEYEEAQELLLEALAPLGEEYLDIVREGYRSRWIDVHENVGKRSGAYSNGVYDTSPYILLNWSDRLRDTFTLAHEMGHSVHSYLTSASQPYVYGSYPIFTAEVASTCNEMLLMHHLLERASDRDRRLFLLDHYLSQINDTVVRQVMFAGFENRIHLAGKEGETLTADLLGDMYQEVLRKYWGPAVEFDPERSKIGWSRVPHFYYNYYVYQYATAYAAAAVLSRRVLAGDAEARQRYLGLLRSGDSRYPVETLQVTGVDLSTPEPVTEVFATFGALIDEVEELLATAETSTGKETT